MTTDALHAIIKKNVRPLPNTIAPLPKVVFTDIDDTLTSDGRLPTETFIALDKLEKANFMVVPVTGASAGWCDCLIKTWPIKHIIGENGALVMEKSKNGVVSTRFMKSSEKVSTDLADLLQIGAEFSKQFPDIKYTQDQPYRITDIAFDIGQAIIVEESVATNATIWLQSQGVKARRSSIHINAWLGNHSKSSGAMSWLQNFNLKKDDCLFIGDSPNDESMFEHFPLSVGVANIDRFLDSMDHRPTYVTENQGGFGFVELANILLKTPNC